MKLRVKELCRSKGLTVTKLGEKLGVKQETMSRAINGNPTLQTLQKIADALGVTIAELFEKPTDAIFQCPNCGKTLRVEIKSVEEATAENMMM